MMPWRARQVLIVRALDIIRVRMAPLALDGVVAVAIITKLPMRKIAVVVIAASLALTTSALASELPAIDDAASNREFIAELYAFSGLSADSPCDNFPGVHDMALGGAVATIVLINQLQPQLTKAEYRAGRDAVTKLQAEGWNTWCQAYAVQMNLAKIIVVNLAAGLWKEAR
jgi:hypothetical protein